MDKKPDYEKIYALLDSVSPLDSDCGQLCGAACCKIEEGEESGMYLLPGEEVMHDMSDPWLSWEEDAAEDYDFPESWKGLKVHFVHCQGAGKCRRALRPIQCRTFPLTPHLTEEGELKMLFYDGELSYHCPLLFQVNMLKKDFVDVTRRAWKMLIKDPRIYDLVWMDSRERDEE